MSGIQACCDSYLHNAPFFTLFSIWLAATLLQQRQLVLDQARATVLRQAQLVSTGMAAFNAAIGHLLDDVLGRIPENSLRQASESMRFAPTTVPMLAHKLARTPFLHGLAVFDQQCVLVASGDSNHAGHRFTASDCDLLRAAMGNDELQIRYVGNDATALGNRLLAFSRNYPASGNQFIGGAVAAIDLQFLGNWLAGHIGSLGETLLVATRDVRTLAQTGAQSTDPATSLFRQYPAVQRAMLPGIEPHVLDTPNEFLGVSHVAGTPFFSVVRTNKDQALLSWRKQATEAVVAVAAVFFLLILLVHGHTRLLRQKQRLERLSVTDELTGVYNRRYLIQAGKHEAERSQRHNHAMALILVDADHFKAVNDAWGHAIGDQVLVQLAQRLAKAVRGSDVLARYGGEEFAILLPETTLFGASRIAERLRQQVSASPVATSGATISLTVSVGLAQLQPDETFEAMLNRADAALYSAKESGRNKVVTCQLNAASLPRHACNAA